MIRICERWFLPLLTLIGLSTVISAQSPIPQGTPPPQSYLPSGGVAWVYAVGALASAGASVFAWLAKTGSEKQLGAIQKARLESMEAVQNARLASMKEGNEKLTEAQERIITELKSHLDYLKITQEETRKASDERLAKYKDQVDLMERVHSVELRTKDNEVDLFKGFLPPDFMKNLIEGSKHYQQISEQTNKEIQKLQGQVREGPLDANATDLALRKDKLELEQQIIALAQAFAMKASSQSFSEHVGSGKDEGKIESALKFLNQLGSTEAASDQKTTEKASLDAEPDERPSRETGENNEDLTDSHR